MALTKINGQDGSGGLSIATVAYDCILNEHEIDMTVDQLDSTTFCTEQTGDYEAGRTSASFRLAGYLTKGAAASGPILPPPQGVALLFKYSTGCTISGTGNFSRAVVRRTAGGAAVIAGEGIFKGALTKVWDVGT